MEVELIERLGKDNKKISKARQNYRNLCKEVRDIKYVDNDTSDRLKLYKEFIKTLDWRISITQNRITDYLNFLNKYKINNLEPLYKYIPDFLLPDIKNSNMLITYNITKILDFPQVFLSLRFIDCNNRIDIGDFESLEDCKKTLISLLKECNAELI